VNTRGLERGGGIGGVSPDVDGVDNFSASAAAVATGETSWTETTAGETSSAGETSWVFTTTGGTSWTEATAGVGSSCEKYAPMVYDGGEVKDVERRQVLSFEV